MNHGPSGRASCRRGCARSTPASLPAAARQGSWSAAGMSWARFHGSEGTKAAARTMWNENSNELSQALPWTAEQMHALVAHLHAAREAR